MKESCYIDLGIIKKLSIKSYNYLLTFDRQFSQNRIEQLALYHDLNYTPIFSVVIAPRSLLAEENKPFIYISFDFEDQWKKQNDNFPDFIFDVLSEAFAPNDFEAMKIRRKSENRMKRIVTTHFYEMISRS